MTDGSSGGGGGGGLMSGSGLFASMHRDVLVAPRPDTLEKRERLVAECKSRAKGAIQAKSWPDAMALYQKCIDIFQEDYEKEEKSPSLAREMSILHANISLCHGKMNEWQKALRCGQQAAEADATYTKALYRVAQAHAALQQHDQAAVLMKRAVETEPDNASLQKELEKMQQRAVEAAAAEKEAAEKDTTTKTDKKIVKKTNENDMGDGVRAMDLDNKDHENEEDDKGVFTKNDHVRGYKIVNGKKTSYFHTELSDDAKKLIGDIAPKKLQPSSQSSAVEATADPTTSAWNKAGTWEERNVTVWAKQTLQDKLLSACFTLPPSSPAPHAVLTVTKVECVGHASVAAVRGKKRYIYEWSPLTVTWKFEHKTTTTTTTTTTTAQGTLVFCDVDGTCMTGEPYEVSSFTVAEATGPEKDHVRPVLDAFVHRDGLRNVLHQKIDAWVQHFRDTY